MARYSSEACTSTNTSIWVDDKYNFVEEPKPRLKEEPKKELSPMAQAYDNVLLRMGRHLEARMCATGISICLSEQNYREDKNLASLISNTRGVQGCYFYERMILGNGFPKNNKSESVLMLGLTEELLDANLFRMFYMCKSAIFMVSIRPGLLKMCHHLMMEARLQIIGTAQIDKSEEYETFIIKCKWNI